jgi:hypothetical protein
MVNDLKEERVNEKHFFRFKINSKKDTCRGVQGKWMS